MRRSWKELLSKFVMFVLTSSLGTVVDLGLHWLLSVYFFKGNYWGSYWIAPTISFELAAITNFCIAYFFVWRERISQRNVRSAGFGNTIFTAPPGRLQRCLRGRLLPQGHRHAGHPLPLREHELAAGLVAGTRSV